MADQYLLHFPDGTEYGPVDRATLRLWHREGRIPPDSLAWPDGAPEWVPVEDVLSDARPAVAGAVSDAHEAPTRELAPEEAPDRRRPPSEAEAEAHAGDLPAAKPADAASPPVLEDLLTADTDQPHEIGSPSEPLAEPSGSAERPAFPEPADREEPSADEGPGPDTQPRAPARPSARSGRPGLSAGSRTLLLLAGGVVIVLVLLGGLVAVLRPALARRSAIAAVERYALADRRVGGRELGFVVDLPPGWVALREDNPFVITRGARLRVAHPALGAFGAVRAEPHPELMGDLDRHLDAVVQGLLPRQPSLVEQGRSDIQLGRGRGRLARVSWQEGGERVQGAIAAWLDGYEYYWLEAWAPASVGEDFVAAFQELMRAVAPSGALAARVEEAAERLAVEVPELSPEALRLLIGMRLSEGESLEGVPVDALRRVSRGLEALSASEAAEMGQIYGQIWEPLSEPERRRLARVLERVKAARPTSAADIRALREVVKAGVVALPPEQRARLQELSGRALEKSLVLP
jgi:hypothetical protein